MKCPKCGYLGFDTGPRCRNCSYDFALLESGEEGALPLDADRGFSMAEPTTEQSADTWLQAIDLGIAAEDAAGPGTTVPTLETPPLETPHLEMRHRDLAPDMPVAVAPPVPDPFAWPGSPAGFMGDDTVATRDSVMSGFAGVDAAPARRPVRTPPLPALDEDMPLVQLQQPRAPIAVRKTPMSPKLRAVARPKPMEPELDFLDEPRSVERPGTDGQPEWTDMPPADDSPASRRLGALFVDALLFGGIDLAVVYLTLRIVGLQMDELQVLPVWPLVGFLGLMKVAYVAVFTAMGGQTIGKMAMHIRVVSADNRALSGGAALKRTLASLVSVVTAGLGYLPGLVGRDRRAIHDRLAGSRVVTLGAA
ncbi:MAG: RDD family protein [Vicinamibacterales bacterium]|nr:RDD family protein [Vicinamibacterales bacterium]